ncbi:206_t:CDS:1, partial [Funneliformis mosseae]
SVSTNNNNKETPVIMDVDPLPLNKEKGKEVLTSEITPVVISNQILININDANDTLENFLNNKKSPQEISTKK